MITIEEARKKFPEVSHLSDKELRQAMDSIYTIASIALDTWAREQQDKKKLALDLNRKI